MTDTNDQPAPLTDALAAERRTVKRLREVLAHAERKLSAYSRGCPADHESRNTLLPRIRAALNETSHRPYPCPACGDVTHGAGSCANCGKGE